MLRKKSKTVPEGNGPTPQDLYVILTLEELQRVIPETMGKAFGEITEDMRRVNQQPRLAMEADVKAAKKTRERTEDAAAAVQAKHGDSCSAQRVQVGLKCSTSFGGDSLGPPALPCSRDNALVGNGAAASKSCLSPLKMRTPTAAGGVLPTETTSTATKITFTSHLFGSARPKSDDFHSIRLVLQPFLEDK